ncbi:MAG TPA: MFS transporter [Anaeromyxobacteraceae bacterium]|nr:MFS transporter [Anaeromyxobacteraceae bacterium]
MRPTSRPLTVVALLLAFFMAAMEMTVVSTAMPTAVGDLGGVHLYAWAFASYMLATTVTVPIHGKLADLHGRKPVLLAGLGLFLLGSALCGQAGSMGALVAFRVVQGLGAGAIQPVAMTIVGDLFDVHERGRMQGIFGAVWGVAGLTGPLLGGAIVHWLSWRWVFYVNLLPGLACAAVLALAYHERVERHEHRLDVGGALLLSAGVVLLLMGARSRQAALLAIPASAAVLLAFLALERRAREPLLPLDLFGGRVMWVASAAAALAGAAMIATVTYVPLWVQGVQGGSPTQAGAAIAPMAVGWPIASALGGRFLTRLGYRLLVRGGLCLAAASAAALWLALDAGIDLFTFQALTALFGAGMGFSNTPLVIAVQTSVPWNRRGVATASSLFFRTMGGTLAVGLLGGLLAASLAAAGAPPGAADRLLGPERALIEPGLLSGLAGALRDGLSGVFAWAAAAAAGAAAVSFFFPALHIEARPVPGAAAD